MSKHYFVWYVEYPDEGAELIKASGLKKAILKVARQAEDADTEYLDGAKATAKQIRRWEASER